MQLGMIGLGRMGGNMTERLLRGGHEVVVYDRDSGAVQAAIAQRAIGASGLAELAGKLAAPPVIWMMLPSGTAVDETISQLLPLLQPGAVLIDGGNSNFKDTLRRAALVRERGLELVDCGTSGGVWGLANGYCLMVGGAAEPVRRLDPVLRTLAPPEGYAHVGPSGAGHYVKMVHNGIEYALLEAYAEGYEILHSSNQFTLDLAQIAALWNRGSVVRSWINELAERAFARDPSLAALKGWVDDSGEGRWTIQEAIDLDVPVPAITLALFARFHSRQQESFGAKVIAALRHEFGGHAVKSA
jgi:6-phosphogluconate dehydrogenase